MSPSSAPSLVEVLIRGAATVESEVRSQKNHINPYGYTPTLYVCALFVALFGLSTLLHLGQAVSTKKWYLLPTVVLGGCGEIIGWAARLWSSQNVLNGTPFLMQISTTIIAPTFLAAANFIILGTIIKRVGPQYSRLAPNNYAIIFVSIDLVALVIQAIGGGMASAATQKVDGNPNNGGHVMLIGIIVQLVEIFVYVVLASGFFRNYAARRAVKDHAAIAAAKKNKKAAKTAGSDEKPASISDDPATVVNTPSASDPHLHRPSNLEKGRLAEGSGEMDGSTRLMSYGLAFSTLFLFIRAVYRTIELSNGWHGRIIHTQVYFNVLDGAMIVLSMYTINFIHPGMLL